MKQINRNFPWCDEYSENSFTGVFHEKCLWDDEEYFKLENEIYDASKELSYSESIPRETAWRIMRIFSYLMMSMGAHTNPYDGFEIKNISANQCRSRVERLQLVFEGFFKGEMPHKEHLEYRVNRELLTMRSFRQIAAMRQFAAQLKRYVSRSVL